MTCTIQEHHSVYLIILQNFHQYQHNELRLNMADKKYGFTVRKQYITFYKLVIQ